MGAPRLSLCIVTVRPGGLDVLLAGLTRQIFDDFEVVLVDALYHRRAEQVADAFFDASIRVVHTPPKDRIFPLDSVPAARNTAIAKASGELIVWGVDYSFFPEACLREHWGVWEYTEKKKAGMGAHRYRYPPTLAYDLPAYAPIRAHWVYGAATVDCVVKPVQGATYQYSAQAGQEFADAIQDGVYDKWMYTIFDPPIKYPEQVLTLDEDPYFFRADPKLNGLVSGDVPPTAFHAKNEGMGAERGREVNGFDESWIGHCYDDSDMGLRLSRSGAAWMLLDPVATVEIVNPRHYFPHSVWRSTPEASLPRFLACEHDSSRIVSGNAGHLVGQKPEWAWYA